MRTWFLRSCLSVILRRQKCSFDRVNWKFKNSLLKVSTCGFESFIRTTMELSSVRKILEETAPLELAEDWDNVGLLIEPTSPRKISHIMLTNDLTETVLEEAIQKQVELIVSYHPPVFRPMKRLRTEKWKDRIVLKCVENCIAVYSPHTALDSVDGGINDWLLRCFDCRVVVPVTSKTVLPKYTSRIKLDGNCSPTYYKMVIAEFLPSVKIDDYSVHDSTVFGTILANEADVAKLRALVAKEDRFAISAIHMEPLATSSAMCGVGRHALLTDCIKISEALEKVKNFLNLQSLRVSLATGCTPDSLVRTVAVCAGSGAEVLSGVKADLLVTGEMSHHALLDAAHRGSTVILTEHSNSERFYLKHLAEVLVKKLPGVTVMCSNCDKDPVLIV